MRVFAGLLIATPLWCQTDLQNQTEQQALAKSQGCQSAACHVGIEAMHVSPAVHLGCTDCHGGRAHTADKLLAHPQPRHRALWPSTANPVRSYTLLNEENPDWVRFVNPGDLRIAHETCGQSSCHSAIVDKVGSSLMSHGAFLWGAALYNNGAYPAKQSVFGESYGLAGGHSVAQGLKANPPPSAADVKFKAMLPELFPLPQFEATQPGNTLRAFERGDNRLSNRGFGTLTRTDPLFQGLQRTRLADPFLFFLGTNDQPGDYRSSGCTACHVIYANDRDPKHSGPYAVNGHLGYSSTDDPRIPKKEEGHPIRHQLTRTIPSSQCVVCHMHPGTSFASQYFGYTWWDNETDGGSMYPAPSKKSKPEDDAHSLVRNPESASLKGNWSDPEFLRNVRDSQNPTNKQTQFADFNGHGWIYRAVYKHDRQGKWQDKDGNTIGFNDPQKFDKAVQLSDIHLDKGMHCVDCHFEQDSHGDGHLYGEPRAAVEIDCIDCHGSIRTRANLRTSNSAAPPGGTNLATLYTPFKRRRFEWRDGALVQRSMVEPDKEWDVSQVLDSITPGSHNYNEKARLAKTIGRDGETWGAAAPADQLAHADERMSCYACHTSWMTSCFGCHLSMKANANRPALHGEGDVDTRNFTTYNFQGIRDDIFMLGLDSTAKNNRIVPVRSSSAVLVSSQNANREWIYEQQQTVSSEGYSGQAFNPHYPHSVRTRETKTCTDCHVSRKNDNNAWMAQLLLQGTNFVNFIGRYAYVGEGRHGLEAVAVTEHDEPQAVIGSYLQKLAYPEAYARHRKTGQLREAYEHGGNILSLQLRGEYLYAAKGKDGVEVYDVANIDNKGFAERIVSAPVSPLGQRLYVKTKDARWIASPTTLAIDPGRRHDPLNEERPIHPLYTYLYVADAREGLILINGATLLDGDPRNNFLKRAATFNPDGLLNGANFVVTAGTYVYISCDRGIVILSLEDPLKPLVVTQISMPGAGHLAVQFRYLFACDREGLKVIDITDIRHPSIKASVAIPDARDVYIARTYAYVAAGKKGLAMVDMERPEVPGPTKYFNADGKMDDAWAVKLGMTNASLFAYVADGKNGLRVLQMTAPDRTEGLWGFSPPPEPELISTYRTKGEAIALSKGLDRDRAVDESGNQLAVFGRRGAGPLPIDLVQRLYLRNGRLYTVTDDPPGPATAAREGSK